MSDDDASATNQFTGYGICGGGEVSRGIWIPVTTVMSIRKRVWCMRGDGSQSETSATRAFVRTREFAWR